MFVETASGRIDPEHALAGHGDGVVAVDDRAPARPCRQRPSVGDGDATAVRRRRNGPHLDTFLVAEHGWSVEAVAGRGDDDEASAAGKRRPSTGSVFGLQAQALASVPPGRGAGDDDGGRRGRARGGRRPRQSGPGERLGAPGRGGGRRRSTRIGARRACRGHGQPRREGRPAACRSARTAASSGRHRFATGATCGGDEGSGGPRVHGPDGARSPAVRGHFGGGGSPFHGPNGSRWPAVRGCR